MKQLLFGTGGALLLALSASASAQNREIEYPNGSLAYDALMKSDYARAEKQLAKEQRIHRDDPARLLNFGLVMAKTGRPDEAASMFRKVLSEDEVELILADGSVAGSHSLARQALNGLSK